MTEKVGCMVCGTAHGMVHAMVYAMETGTWNMLRYMA